MRIVQCRHILLANKDINSSVLTPCPYSLYISPVCLVSYIGQESHDPDLCRSPRPWMERGFLHISQSMTLIVLHIFHINILISQRYTYILSWLYLSPSSSQRTSSSQSTQSWPRCIRLPLPEFIIECYPNYSSYIPFSWRKTSEKKLIKSPANIERGHVFTMTYHQPLNPWPEELITGLRMVPVSQITASYLADPLHLCRKWPFTLGSFYDVSHSAHDVAGCVVFYAIPRIHRIHDDSRFLGTSLLKIHQRAQACRVNGVESVYTALRMNNTHSRETTLLFSPRCDIPWITSNSSCSHSLHSSPTRHSCSFFCRQTKRPIVFLSTLPINADLEQSAHRD